MKTKRLIATVFALMCIPLVGAWSAASAEQATAETRYTGGQAISTYATETIAYTTKTVVEDIATANDAPYYTSIDGLTNSCGAVAGAITVGFYDKYYPNLIPGWNSAYSSGRYRNQDGKYIPELMRDLYVKMQTNSTGAGVTQNEYKNGLINYINGQGYSVSFDSIGSGTNIDYGSLKTSIQNNRVVTLFVNPSNVYAITMGSGVDTIDSSYIAGNHILIAYGYYEVRYNLAGGGTKTDTYLKVSTGIQNLTDRFYKVGSYVEAAYTVKIN